MVIYIHAVLIPVTKGTPWLPILQLLYETSLCLYSIYKTQRAQAVNLRSSDRSMTYIYTWDEAILSAGNKDVQTV